MNRYVHGMAKLWISAVLGVAVYSVGVWAVTEAAGGTKVDPAYSNTPNGVTSAPPDFRQ